MAKERIVNSGKTDPVEVCANAAGRQLKSVLVIGIQKDGKPYYAGSTSSARKIKAMVGDFEKALDL